MHMLDIIRLPRRVPDYPILYYHYNTMSTLSHFISLGSVILFFIILCTMKRKFPVTSVEYTYNDPIFEKPKKKKTIIEKSVLKRRIILVPNKRPASFFDYYIARTRNEIPKLPSITFFDFNLRKRK